ncbi:hypothetical protein OIU78_029436, partial [Salix suchowensis]
MVLIKHNTLHVKERLVMISTNLSIPYGRVSLHIVNDGLGEIATNFTPISVISFKIKLK